MGLVCLALRVEVLDLQFYFFVFLGFFVEGILVGDGFVGYVF